MKTTFWVCGLILFYIYVGYPVILAVLTRFRRAYASTEPATYPKVTMLLTVYNEESVIQDKMRNILSLDYPADRFECLIVSDGCTDKTETLILENTDPRIRLIIQPERGGKTKALNTGAAQAKGEILVFTDANAMFEPDALRHLAARFGNPDIGLVSGRTQYINAQTGKAESAGLYRRYEEWIKAKESLAFSIVGADGAIYAMRQSLYKDLPASIINDLVHTFDVVSNGYMAISEQKAVCLEQADDEEIVSFSRQTRIMTQSWLVVLSSLAKFPIISKFGYVWQVISHKVLRWLTLPLMAALFISTILLAWVNPFYLLAGIAQTAFYGLVLRGASLESGLPRTAYHFFMIQASSLLGLYKYFAGKQFITWEPRAG